METSQPCVKIVRKSGYTRSQSTEPVNFPAFFGKGPFVNPFSSPSHSRRYISTSAPKSNKISDVSQTSLGPGPSLDLAIESQSTHNIRPRKRSKYQWNTGQESLVPKPRPLWAIRQQTLRKNYPEGWAPIKRISRDAMELVRNLHDSDPKQFSTPVLAKQFKISSEAIRRVLRSKWRADPATLEKEKRRALAKTPGRRLVDVAGQHQRAEFAKLERQSLVGQELVPASRSSQVLRTSRNRSLE